MVQPIGYIKLWRELLTKPIWYESTPEQKVILITLLSMANFGGKQWEWQGRQYKAEPGQLVTSLARLAAAAGEGVTMQNVRTALVRFEKYGFLTNESTKTGRLITIVNWRVYQSNEGAANKEDNKDLTKSQQRPNKQLTTREEGYEVKKDNLPYSSDFLSFWETYPRRKEKQAAFKAWQKAVKVTDPDLLIKAATGYANQCQRDGTAEKYIKHAATFLNTASFEDYLETAPEPKPPAEDSYARMMRLSREEEQ